MIISAKEANSLAMADLMATEGFKENLDNYLSSISNRIEKVAREGFLETAYELNGIHSFFGFNIIYFDTLCSIVIERLTQLGYEAKHYENMFGHWLRINWCKPAKKQLLNSKD